MKNLFILGLAAMVLSLNFAHGNTDYRISVLSDGTEYFDNRLIVTNVESAPAYETNRIVDGFAVTGVESVDRLCHRLNIVSVEKFYPGNLRNEILKRIADKIFVFTLGDGANIFSVASELTGNPFIERAEIQTIPRLFYTPNDPLISQQWYLEQTQTYAAWDYVRGDTTRHSIIAIIDTGINYNHEDLAANIWINELEEYNGEDDDDNGYIDDVMGWNFDNGTNNPMDINGHGTGVAGSASEVTDNATMGAGIGFSARLMNLKAISDNGYLAQPYAAMIYAADNGAQIVNCSWGIPSYSQYEQDIVNAVWDSDVLIIAAGGDGDQLVYPAAYSNVVAVSATDQNDHRAPFAPYGEYIDICAPGVNISIPWGNGFATVSGTSFAASMVSGVAALVRAAYPDLTNVQSWQLIADSADPIDDLNPGYEGLLGEGRINAVNCVMTGIDSDPYLPQLSSLLKCYPNPFNAVALLRYTIDKPSDVEIDIYDILGRKVETLYKGAQPAGSFSVSWNAGDLVSGIYFARLEYGGQNTVARLVLLK